MIKDALPDARKAKEYTGTETDVVVPDTMDEGVPVKRLGTQLLAGSETLTSVVVPDSVTILDVGALSYDNNLSEITLSSNLINIGWNAISSNDALKQDRKSTRLNSSHRL